MTDTPLDDLVAEPVTTTGPVEHDDQDDLDDVAVATFAKMPVTKVRTSGQAIVWGREQITKQTKGWSGYCWKFARSCFNVGPLAPSAIAGWHMAGPRHQNKCSAAKAPRGYVGCFSGGQYGHAVLTLGGGRCISNDTQGDDQVHVANIADIENAWGYKFLGTIDEVNGELAPPAKAAPKPSPMTMREWKLQVLRNARSQAKSNGHPARAKRLQRWIDQLVKAGRK